MKKGHRTVFQNAWSKKTNTLIKKTILFQKNDKFIWKKATEPIFQNAWSQKKQHSD